jgi:hypothetical protein
MLDQLGERTTHNIRLVPVASAHRRAGPGVSTDEAVDKVGNCCVHSHKPNSAGVRKSTWNLDKAGNDLETLLEKAKAHGCVVEVIMKASAPCVTSPSSVGSGPRPRVS